METECVWEDEESSGAGWWGWLQHRVSVLNATEHLEMDKMVNFLFCIFYYKHTHTHKTWVKGEKLSVGRLITSCL